MVESVRQLIGDYERDYPQIKLFMEDTVQQPPLKISPTDGVGGFLESKLLAGDGVTFTKKNTGGNETITISSDLGDLGGTFLKRDGSTPLTASWDAGAFIITANGFRLNDNESMVFGTGGDASILYDGTNFVINPKVVGSGIVSILGDLVLDKDLTVNGDTILGAGSVNRVEFNAQVNSNIIFSNDANRTIRISEVTSGNGRRQTIQAGGTTASASIGGLLNLVGGFNNGVSNATGGNATLNGGPSTTTNGNALVGNSRGNTFLGRTGGDMSMFGVSAVSQALHIIDPTGGLVVDPEARTAINAILVVIENIGLTAKS